MTIPEFLAELSSSPFKWTLIGSSIRTVAPICNYDCPISAVWKGRSQSGNTYEVFRQPVKGGLQLGLSNEDAKTIIAAADLDDNYNPQIRLQLLKACRL